MCLAPSQLLLKALAAIGRADLIWINGPADLIGRRYRALLQ
jgi:hypothetical protein